MGDRKVCVVGAGYWGKNHIRTLYELDALGGIVENNTALLQDISKFYPNMEIYSSLDDALKNDEFAGFTVATPAETHYELSKLIIEANKHVLVEKPFTLNIENAEELIKLADDNNVNLMVGHVLLFHPAVKKIKDLISTGKIGKLQYVYSNRLNLGQVRTRENVFWSLAPHDVAIFQYLSDSFPVAVKARGSAFLQKGIPDSTITQLKYANGIEGHIFVSWLHPFKEHRLVIIGSEAMITFEDSIQGKPLNLYSKKIDFKSGIPEKIDGPVKLIEYSAKMPLTEELSYFVDHLNGKKPKISNGEHALDVTRILVDAGRQLEIL
jgi:UDP-2-acetamido-3-amino-2,3-dideoxy-glucuronate N-acetyltransferase